MHGGQGLPIFEYNLAPYVCKSFAKNIIATLNTVLRTDNPFKDVFNFVNQAYEDSGDGEYCRTVMDQKGLQKIGT